MEVGDSFKSDYIMARKSGIEAIHIPTHIVKQGFTLKENGIEENIINSFLNNTRPTSENQYYRFGYEKFGMFLWGYSKWLHESVTKSGIKKIYFFSRDGLIMKKAFDLLFQDVETYYLEVSRRSLRVPILWMNYDLEHVLNMISPSKLVPLATLFDGVGLDINNYAELIEEYGFNLKTSFDRKQILKDQKLSAMYARLGADIEKVSKEEYELLVEYIKQNNLSGKFAIVDIGWSGGMQRYLSETLDMLKIDHSIKGYYIGVADYYKRNIEVIPDLDLNGYLFDFLHGHYKTLNYLLHVLAKPIVKSAQYRCACSKIAAEWMFDTSKNVSIIRNGVDIEKFKFNQVARNSVREKLDISGKIVIGSVSDFSYQKNPDFIYELIKEFQNDERYIFLFVGNRANGCDLKKLVDEDCGRTR